MTGPKAPRSWLRAATILAGVLVLVLAVGYLRPGRDNATLLRKATSWTYQLQGGDRDIARLATTAGDVLVIDYAMRAAGGMRPLTRDEVTALKRKPDGGRRIVVSYLSIGEAEEYRPYWQAAWKETPPAWIIGPNCRWPDNHLVRFWQDGWKNVVYSGKESYLARIQAAGFDGVYLDRIDVYAEVEKAEGDARQEMIRFVGELAKTGRARDDEFLIIAQNAEELLDDAGYRGVIDAIAKEDLLYGLEGTGKRNGADEVAFSESQLQRLARDGKPVFAVEYLNERRAAEAASEELAKLGFIPAIAARALDGSDPFAPPSEASGESGITPAADMGTPEFAKRNCGKT